jgi:subtilisin family serine protease
LKIKLGGSKMKRVIKTNNLITTRLLLFVLVIAVMVSWAYPQFDIHNIVNASAYGDDTQEVVRYSTATVDDDFSDDSILIVLNKNATRSYKNYSVDDFPEIGCFEVIDITYPIKEMFLDWFEYNIPDTNIEMFLEQLENDSDIDNYTNSELLVNVKEFRSILKVSLNDKSKENVIASINALEGRDDLLYVGPNYVHEIASVQNPAQFAEEQWAIEQIGLPAAWDITTGSASVKVGIIDTGVDGTHPDLVDRLNNGLHMDFSGSSPLSLSIPTDAEGHGTHVAGIIGASRDIGNGTPGVVGACMNVNLVSLKISENGSWFADKAVLAVTYGASHGIQVLNYSGRVRNRSNVVNINDPAFEQALTNYSGLFVAAAGNKNTTSDNPNNDVSPQYPSNYSANLSNVISVGATDASDTKASYSFYGATTVSIFAPGGSGGSAVSTGILSTFPEARWGTTVTGYNQIAQGYAVTNGTSMAAPYVTGVAALLLSANPSLTGTQLKSAILNNADTVPALSGLCVTGGRLNAFAAVQSVAIQISTAQQLSNIRNNPSGNYILVNDIDLSSFGQWTPIPTFTGTLVGNNKTISNLHIVIPNTQFTSNQNFGLFGRIDGGIVQNLKLNNVNIDGSATQHSGEWVDTGTLTGVINASSTIDNVEVNGGTINVNRYSSHIGGLVGRADASTIKNSRVNNLSISGNGDIGGIAGYSGGSNMIRDSQVNEVTINYSWYGVDRAVGGIVGYNTGSTLTWVHTLNSTIVFANTSTTPDMTPYIGMIVGHLINSTMHYVGIEVIYADYSNRITQLNPGNLPSSQRTNFGATLTNGVGRWAWGGNTSGANSVL